MFITPIIIISLFGISNSTGYQGILWTINFCEANDKIVKPWQAEVFNPGQPKKNKKYLWFLMTNKYCNYKDFIEWNLLFALSYPFHWGLKYDLILLSWVGISNKGT